MSAKSKRTEVEANVQPEGSDTLWAEWSDAQLNSENWAIPKNGADGSFADAEAILMPPSLEPFEWIRASELKNLSEPLTVFAASDSPDLVTCNNHLLHSEFVRWFISALINLQHCGREGLEISGESGNFVWNGRHQPWRGWMNVYSMNKAGKGAVHRPVVNPNGKYIVRLHFLGCWRRVVVDDMVPVNHEGKSMLPSTANNFELWPLLLSKALLKLSSLTSTRREIVDFHPVTCLTGWVCLRLDINYLSPQDKWDFLTKYAEHFEWQPEVTEVEDKVSTLRKQGSVKSKTNSGAKESKEKLKVPSNPRPVTLFLGLDDMKKLGAEDVPGLSPCWNHFVYVAQSRDIPLDPKDVKPPLARWKLYRWLNWAIKRGLIDPCEYFVPIRSLKIVSSLKKCKESIINIYKNEFTSFVQNTSESRKNDPRKGKLKEELPVDPSFWADFNKIEPYINDVHFFYKLEYFQYTARVSDTLNPQEKNTDAQDKKSDAKKAGKNDSKKSSPSKTASARDPEFLNVHRWLRKLSAGQNDPLYLFCDSLDDKFFLIDFSTYPPSPRLDPALRSRDYIVFEEHSWFHRPRTSDPLATIATSGVKATVAELPPGRHLLRIYTRWESHYFLTISSDTIFHLGDRQTMHSLMRAESERVDRVARKMSNSISRAYQAFGSENYPQALREYYRSYTPVLREPTRKDVIFCGQLHEYVIDEMVELVRATFPPEEVKSILRSLRIFFINPSIGLERFDTISIMLKSLQLLSESKRLQENSLDRSLADYDHAASVIQSSFKMLTIKKYRKIHDPSHDENEAVLGNLLKVAQLFDHGKGESLANLLLRNVVKHHDRLYELYPFSQDFRHVIQVQEFRGTLANVRAHQWLPICRLILNAHELETVFASFDLFVNLSKRILRVFNNDTGLEMLPVANNVAPAGYRYAKNGYTVFAYGSSEERAKEVDWKIHVTTMKGEPVFRSFDDEELPLESRVPALSVEELSNTYIPNSKNSIAKWVVRVARRTFVSLRLKVSYDSVKIRMRVDEAGKTLAEGEGTSVVILPVVCLQLEDEGTTDEENSLENVYYVEAVVLDESWPLTEAEWTVVAEAKAKAAKMFARGKLSSASSAKVLGRPRKGSKQSIDSGQSLEAPYWTLQVVTDPGSGLEIHQDRTRDKQLALLKETWANENPGSLERGRELREAFVNKHALPASMPESKVSSLSSNDRLSRKSSDRPTIDPTPVPKVELRTLKPPQSTGNNFPPLDLSIYMLAEEEEEKPWVKTDYDEETLRNRREIDAMEARNNYESFLENVDHLLHDQRQKYLKYLTDHKNSFWERRLALSDVYEARKIYLATTKTANATSTTKSARKERKI